jgi:hypothetical protein
MGNRTIPSCFCGEPGSEDYALNLGGKKIWSHVLFCSSEHRDHYSGGPEPSSEPGEIGRDYRVMNGDYAAAVAPEGGKNVLLVDTAIEKSRTGVAYDKLSRKNRVKCPALDRAARQAKAKLIGEAPDFFERPIVSVSPRVMPQENRYGYDSTFSEDWGRHSGRRDDWY